MIGRVVVENLEAIDRSRTIENFQALIRELTSARFTRLASSLAWQSEQLICLINMIAAEIDRRDPTGKGSWGVR